MKKIKNLPDSELIKELQLVMESSPKVNSLKSEKMASIKDELEANVKSWGWVK
jgi:hypothetical protein